MIDMRAVTRLTKAGRLSEAMAILQRGGSIETAPGPASGGVLGQALRHDGREAMRSFLGRAGKLQPLPGLSGSHGSFMRRPCRCQKAPDSRNGPFLMQREA